MSTAKEIEEAIRQLPAHELDAFRRWFADFDAAEWDRQIASDESAGRLKALADEALRDLRDGRTSKL